MKLEIRACGLALLVPSPASARASQWWYVAQGADKMLFVDVESIQRDATRFDTSPARSCGNPEIVPSVMPPV